MNVCQEATRYDTLEDLHFQYLERRSRKKTKATEWRTDKEVKEHICLAL